MKQPGFTLVEILIVTAIISLFSGLALMNYGLSSEDKKLELEAKKFVEILQLTEKKTLAGEKPCLTYDNRWELLITTSTSYLMRPLGCVGLDVVYTLPKSLFFFNDKGSPLSSGTFRFNFLGIGGMEQGSPCCSVFIKNTVINKTRQIIINRGGPTFSIH